jgi:D-3-phosphoglycerate dehydrogenase
LFSGLAGGAPSTLELLYEGEIADYDCRVLTLAVLKGALGAVLDEPVSFVNAPQLAESRGVSVRETTSSSALDFVNLITLRGRRGDRPVHVAGTLFGRQAVPRVVGIEDHTVDLPPSSHMLVVRNADIPNMIGQVASIIGSAGINIAQMHIGTNAAGESALMALSTVSPVPDRVVDQIRRVDGVTDARAIELD